MHPPAARPRRDLLEPGEPQDLPVRRRNRERDGAARRRRGLSTQSEVNFQFALAKAYEDRGDFERGWEHYRARQRQAARRSSYDPVQTEVMNDRLDQRFHAGVPRVAPRGRSRGSGRRSSSWACRARDRRCSSRSWRATREVEGTSELPYLGRVATWLNRNRADGINYPEAVRELPPSAFGHSAATTSATRACIGAAARHASSTRCRTTFRTSAFSSLILPHAKIIDARRHPLDACLSCYRQLFAKGQAFTYDLTEIGEYYLQYQRMMDHWHACCRVAC